MFNKKIKLIDIFNNEPIPGLSINPWVYRAYVNHDGHAIIDRLAGCLDNELYLIKYYPDDSRRWLVKVGDKIAATLTTNDLLNA